MRVAIVGHVEWVEFAHVPRVPDSGDIIHATGSWEEVGGGGAVAAVQLAKLAGESTFLTTLGDDDLGHRALEELEAKGVRVHATFRGTQRRAMTFVEPAGERTITTLGEKLRPSRDDPLPWDELGEFDAVDFIAADVEALRAVRQAGVVVATTRELPTLVDAGVQLDAVVGSGNDEAEGYPPGAIDPAPRFVVTTAGAGGGAWTGVEGRTGKWEAASLPGPIRDAYGCGDSFAAGLTFALGEGREIDEALAFAARCGAACMTGHGPYEGQLTLEPR